ncbi:MAG: HAD domain-containing protein [Rhodoferax sp.]
MNGIVLFLDLDDVLCLNNPFGGYDVLELLLEVRSGHKTEADLQAIWNQLFDDGAKANLANIHDEFAPVYVMSTSWSRFCDRSLLEAILQSTGLSFVADNLHEDWETEKATGQTRAEQVRSWLHRHPEFERRWVVIDDEASGSGLNSDWFAADGPFVVLCDVGIGLDADKSRHLRQAFLARQWAGDARTSP